MIKINLDLEKDIEEIEVQGNTMEILEETTFIAATILLETYKDVKKEIGISLEEYLTPFIEVLKEVVLNNEEEENENEIVVTKAKLNKDQAAEVQKILESKNDEALLNFLKNIL